MEEIYFNIGDFVILFKILTSEKPYHSAKFIEMLKNDYGGFVAEKTSKPDFSVTVFHRGGYAINSRKLKGSKTVDFNATLFHINLKRKILHLGNPPGPFEFEFMINYLLGVYLLPKTGFILHGSSVGYKGESYIFEGPEGAGKSTTSQLLKGLCDVLSDDSVIVRNIKGSWQTYQTLLNEKNFNFKKTSISNKPKGLFFVKKADECKIEKIKNKELILRKVLKQLFTYQDKVSIQFPLLVKFVNENNFYNIYVKKDEQAFKKFFKKEVSTL